MGNCTVRIIPFGSGDEQSPQPSAEGPSGGDHPVERHSVRLRQAHDTPGKRPRLQRREGTDTWSAVHRRACGGSCPEGSCSEDARVRRNNAFTGGDHLERTLRRGLSHIQQLPGRINGCLAGTGLPLSRHPTTIRRGQRCSPDTFDDLVKDEIPL
jgi:hypothetical protein